MARRQPMSSLAADPSGKSAQYSLDEWETAVRKDPTSINLRMYLCRRLASMGRFEEAIRHCEECLAAQPGNSPVSTSRRLRIIVMIVRLRRAMVKTHDVPYANLEGC